LKHVVAIKGGLDLTNEIGRAAVVGTVVIRSSWAALFLATGLKVVVYDPTETVEQDVRNYVARAWPTLEALGRAKRNHVELVDNVAGFTQSQSVRDVRRSIYST
jgi:3-hydroxyacyl-CoA dehydrogenase